MIENLGKKGSTHLKFKFFTKLRKMSYKSGRENPWQIQIVLEYYGELNVGYESKIQNWWPENSDILNNGNIA